MNKKEKKLLKSFLKENLKKLLNENPKMLLTEEGFWDWIQQLLQNNSTRTAQQDQTIIQNLRNEIQQLKQYSDGRDAEIMRWVEGNYATKFGVDAQQAARAGSGIIQGSQSRYQQNRERETRNSLGQ